MTFDLEKYRERLKAASETFDVPLSDLGDALDEVERLEEERDDLKREVESAAEETNDLEKRVDELQDELHEVEKDRDRKAERLAELGDA